MMKLNEQFSAINALRFGWHTFSENAGYCCGFLGLVEAACIVAAAVLAFHFVLAAQMLFQLDSPPPESYVLAFLVIYFCLRCPAQVLLNRWLLLLSDQQYVSYSELFSFDFLVQIPLIIRLAAASFIFNCYCLLGTCFLILPGVLVSSTLRFYKFLIIDSEADAVQSLRESYELTRDYKGQLVGLNVLCTTLKVLGLCVFGIGWVPASAVCGLAEAYAYRKLLEEPAPEAPPQRAYLN
jgi:hypothetical protein